MQAGTEAATAMTASPTKRATIWSQLNLRQTPVTKAPDISISTSTTCRHTRVASSTDAAVQPPGADWNSGTPPGQRAGLGGRRVGPEPKVATRQSQPE